MNWFLLSSYQKNLIVYLKKVVFWRIPNPFLFLPQKPMTDFNSPKWNWTNGSSRRTVLQRNSTEDINFIKIVSSELSGKYCKIFTAFTYPFSISLLQSNKILTSLPALLTGQVVSVKHFFIPCQIFLAEQCMYPVVLDLNKWWAIKRQMTKERWSWLSHLGQCLQATINFSSPHRAEDFLQQELTHPFKHIICSILHALQRAKEVYKWLKTNELETNTK